MNSITNDAESNEQIDARQTRFQFSLKSALALMVWLSVVLALWLNVQSGFALLFTLIATYVVYRCSTVLSKSWSIGNVTKVTVLLIASAAVFMLPSAMGLHYWMFQPMLNRQTRAVAHQLDKEVRADSRFKHVEISTARFKGHEHIHVLGTVSSQADLDDLEAIVRRPDKPVWFSAEVDAHLAHSP